jgi:hypothetical protein
MPLVARPRPVALPPELAAPQLPEVPDPAARLPADALPALDAAVAPALQARMTEMSARLTAQQTAADAEVARVNRDFDARLAQQTEQARAQQDQIIARSEASIEATRAEWREQNRATRTQWSQPVQAEQSAASAEIQAMAADGEAQADAALTEGETRARATQEQAQARAQAILAEAQNQASAARSAASGSSGGPVQRQVATGFEPGHDAGLSGQISGDDADEIMARAQAQVSRELARARAEMKRLRDSAHTLTEEQIARRVREIDRRIEELNERIKAQVDEALGDRFPTLEAFYLGEIDRMLDSARSQIMAVGGALMNGDQGLAHERMTVLTDVFSRRNEQLQAVLEDVETLAHFNDVDEALEAFGITLQVDGADATSDNAIWTPGRKENALGSAIRLENAFRDADTGSLLDSYDDPGAAFSAIMGGVEFDYISNTDNTGAEVDETGGDTYGHRVKFYTFSDNEMYHFAHEIGHLFNMNATNDPYEDLQTEEITAPASYNRTRNDNGGWRYEFALWGETLEFNSSNGGDKPIYYLRQEKDENNEVISQERFLIYVDDGAANMDVEDGVADVVVGGGSDSSRHITSNFGMQCPDYGDSGCFPYQQNTAQVGNDGEEYADMYANWGFNSFTENPAGDARDQWMENHMTDWIAQALERNSS